jgi:hypothetical protein
MLFRIRDEERGVGKRREGKRRHQSGGWRVPEEGTFCTLIRSGCKDVLGPAENPNLLSCDGGFARSFVEEMTGFLDLKTEAIHISSVGMGLNANCLPEDATRVTGSGTVSSKSTLRSLVIFRDVSEERSSHLQCGRLRRGKNQHNVGYKKLVRIIPRNVATIMLVYTTSPQEDNILYSHRCQNL